MPEKSVVIVGAGIVGLCSAYYLNKKGFKVTIIDASDGTQNCSVGNAGYFCPSHVVPLAAPGIITKGIKWMLNEKSPFYVRPRLNRDLISWGLKFTKAATKHRVEQAAPILHGLTTTSQSLIEEIISDEKLDVGYTKKGLMMACQSEKELEHEIAAGETARSFGQEVEILTSAEASKLNPGLDVNMIGAVYFPNDSMITPHAFVKSFQQTLKDAGVIFMLNTPATKIHFSADQITKIDTSEGSLLADEFIIAAGSRSGEFVKQLGLNLPMQGGKGYSFMVQKENIHPETPVIFSDGKVSMSPMMDGIRFSGTMEIDKYNTNINPKRIEGIIETVMRFLPQFSKDDFIDLNTWFGFRPCSPDGFPYLGRTKKYKNLTIATGHAMLGVTLGPVSGKLVTDTLTGEAPFMDLSLLDVDRYS